MVETTGNYCPRCKLNQMRIKEHEDGSTTGVCHNCGYQFSKPKATLSRTQNQSNISQLLKTINEYAFIIAIVAMVLSFFTLTSVTSLNDYTVTNLNTLNTEFSEKLNTLNESFNSTTSNHTEQIGFIITSVNSISSTLTALQNLNINISQAEQLISNINETLTQLNNQYITQQSFLNNTNCTLKITEYPNQNTTDTFVFSTIEITISNPNTTLRDTTLRMFYPNSNWNVTGSDNAMLPISILSPGYIETTWIENTNEHHIELRLEWNTTSYSTTEVGDFTSSLRVNNNYFNFYIERDTDLSSV